MLCDRILGNLASLPADVDPVDLTWPEQFQRALRKRTRLGRDLKILLPRGVSLSHGDVLLAATVAYPPAVVNVLPTDVLIARPPSIAQAARLAHELGHLHAPLETDADTLICLADGPAEALLLALDIGYTTQSRRFRPRLPQCAPQFAIDFQVTRINPSQERAVDDQ